MQKKREVSLARKIKICSSARSTTKIVGYWKWHHCGNSNQKKLLVTQYFCRSSCSLRWFLKTIFLSFSANLVVDNVRNLMYSSFPWIYNICLIYKGKNKINLWTRTLVYVIKWRAQVSETWFHLIFRNPLENNNSKSQSRDGRVYARSTAGCGFHLLGRWTTKLWYYCKFVKLN